MLLQMMARTVRPRKESCISIAVLAAGIWTGLSGTVRANDLRNPCQSASVEPRIHHVEIVQVQNFETIDIPEGVTNLIIDKVEVESHAGKLLIRRGGKSSKQLAVRINRISSRMPNVTSSIEPTIELSAINISDLFIRGDPDGNKKAAASLRMTDGAKADRISILQMSGTSVDVSLSGECYSRIDISESLIEELTIRGRGAYNSKRGASVELNYHVNRVLRGGRPRLVIQDLEIANANIRISDAWPTQNLCPVGSLNIQLAYVNFNRPRMSLSPAGLPAGAKVDLTNMSCADVSLEQVSLNYDVEIRSSALGELVLNGIAAAAGVSTTLEVDTRNLRAFRAVDTSLDNFTLRMDASNDAKFNVPVFSRVSANGTVNIPYVLVDQLRKKLEGASKAEQTSSNYARSFLASLRSAGVFEDGTPVVREVLFHLLRLETRRNYAWPIEYILLAFTGYGIRLLWPLLTFIGYVAALGMLNTYFMKKRLSISDIGQGVMGLFDDAPFGRSDSPVGARCVRWLFRVLVILQVTLVGLFIQNSVIVGFM